MKKLIVYSFSLILLLATASNCTAYNAAIFISGTVMQNPADKCSRFLPGDIAYVHASSGLMLRDKPSPSGGKLTTIPYGESVLVEEDKGECKAHRVNELPEYDIKGFWVKVTYGKQTGYVFDGFLSRHPGYKENQDFDQYFEQESKLIKTNTTPPAKKNDADANVFLYEEKTYSSGVVTLSEGYEGGSKFSIKYPSALYTFDEVYLLEKKREGTLTEGKKWVYNAQTRTINITDPSEMTGFVISQEGDYIISESSVAD